MLFQKRLCQIFFIALFLSFSCTSYAAVVCGEGSYKAMKERDQLNSLAAYAIVNQDWQTAELKPRGHNIGSILTDPNGIPVAWGLNRVIELKDKTQHGEVQVIQKYLKEPRTLAPKGTLENYIIYTTLEPCVMCTGMMSMIGVKKSLYGQTEQLSRDNIENKTAHFGKSIDRLRLPLSNHEGIWLPAFPRLTKIIEPSDVPYKGEVTSYTEKIDAAFNAVNKDQQKDTVAFLLTTEAQTIFQSAEDELSALINTPANLQCIENKTVIEKLKKLINAVK